VHRETVLYTRRRDSVGTATLSHSKLCRNVS
jgi:hypothetical protein